MTSSAPTPDDPISDEPMRPSDSSRPSESPTPSSSPSTPSEPSPPTKPSESSTPSNPAPPSEPAKTSDPSAPSIPRRELRAFGELFALSGLAIAQPILDVFGRSPDQFIFRGAERGDILAFALLVVFAVPVGLLIVEAVIGLVSRTAREIVHTVFLGVLATIFLTLLLDHVLPRIAANVLALLLAIGFAVLFRRTRGVRIWLAFLTPAPIVFLAVFLLASQTARLLEGPAGALGTPVRNPTPTVLILLDELPLVTLLDEDGDIDRDLFPNFARLADTSHWFRQTTTVSNFTWTAVPSLLTGTLPRDGTTPDSISHPNNLFTLVGGAMPVTSSEVVTRLCPASVCERIDADTGGLRALLGDVREILQQRLSPTDPVVDPMDRLVEDAPLEPAEAVGDGEFQHLDGDRGSDRFNRFLDSLGTDEAGLHHLHLLLPHSPYRFLPDGTSYDGPEPGLGRFFDGWLDNPAMVTVARQQYLLQLQWTDALLGRIIDRLVETGTWDSSNVVLVSDHGYGFEPRGPVRAKDGLLAEDDRSIAELAWIPFFVKAAHQDEREISDDPIRSVDVAPTIADLLDVEIPWRLDGRSAFDGGSGDPDEIGLNLSEVAPEQIDTGTYRTLDRQLGWNLLMERTTGAFAPARDGATGSDRIFRVGPRPDLIGRPAPTDRPAIDVAPADYSRADDVDLAGGTVPALFHAVAPESEVGNDVAIAVNGTIRATAEVQPALTVVYEEPTVSAILPAHAFVDGTNTITVHRIG